MDANYEGILEAALRLPVIERASLARLIAGSVNEEIAPASDFETEWDDEALRRIQAYDRGELAHTDAARAMMQARAALV